MKKRDLQVLIVEDDRATGKALSEAFDRSGVSARVCAHPTEAERVFRSSTFHLVIMDCMLPGTNGVELASTFRTIAPNDFHLILTSGVFKTASFAKEAVEKTKADFFFNKPFNLAEFIDGCLDLFSDQLEEDIDPLFELLQFEALSAELVSKAISESGVIQGPDLALLYNYIYLSRLSGTLELRANSGTQSSVEFVNGEVSKVNVADKMSYFGILLIENGFTDASEIEDHLSQSDSRPIGLRLVESHTISPHAIQLVLKQQMCLRLSKTIQSEAYEVSFTASENQETPKNVISENELAQLTNDWIDSKLDRNTLLHFYLPWMEHTVVMPENLSRFDTIKDLPILRSAPKVFKHIERQISLHELMALSGVNETAFLSLIHFLVVQKVVYFTKELESSNSSEHRMRYLKSLAKGMSSKNHFQILGLLQGARTKEIERAYLDLAKVVHPDKLEASAPKELKELNHEVFAKINEAYGVLKDKASRDKYIKKLSTGDAETILLAESKITEGEQYLRRGEYSKAYSVFKEVYKLKSPRADVPILLTWALLKAPTAPSKAKQIESTAQALLKKVPPEGRHQPKYFLARGLYLSFIGEVESAGRHFINAYTADPTLIEARRELIRLKRMNAAKQSSSKTIITKLLKKIN